MRVMAIDYGDARTGVAISDPTGTLTGSTAVLPSWPTISWSTMEKEDWSMDCSPTGTAIPMTSARKDFFFIHKHPPFP